MQNFGYVEAPDGLCYRNPRRSRNVRRILPHLSEEKDILPSPQTNPIAMPSEETEAQLQRTLTALGILGAASVGTSTSKTKENKNDLS